MLPSLRDFDNRVRMDEYPKILNVRCVFHVLVELAGAAGTLGVRCGRWAARDFRGNLLPHWWDVGLWPHAGVAIADA